METMQQLFSPSGIRTMKPCQTRPCCGRFTLCCLPFSSWKTACFPLRFYRRQPADSCRGTDHKDTLDFPTTLIVLTAGASLGCWVGYLQGRWLSNTKIVKGWLSHLPPHYHQRAHSLFHRHGLAALLVGRFLAFVRTLLPMLAGIAGLNSRRFQFFNWLSGFLWVGILTSLGYCLGISPIFRKYEHHLMNILMLIPVVLLVFGLLASLWVVWKRKRTKTSDDTHAQ